MKDTKYRKRLGDWGETQVDIWLEKHQWIPIRKNLKLKRGEIDRIYSSYSEGEDNHLCIAEIKTNIITSQKRLFEIFSEIGIKKYIKYHQIRNLRYIADYFILRYHAKIHIRIFIVLKIKYNFNKSCLSNLNYSIKICFICDEFIIISIEPEYTNLNFKKNLLEVLI
ncbi:YraN family protein [Fluviispira vulneris]|uniref:YraN family protein n=1 Tax=Fluviispira vulneris TaxID=2763012 RepID=UPI001647A200|nr:YraN family protein [Fluviispira vulneris]